LVLQQNRLRWYGYVLRKEDDDWVKKCMELEVEGRRPRGRHESHSCIVLYQLLDCQQFQNPYLTIPALQFNTSRALHPAVIYIESMDATVLVEYLPITATIFTTRCYARVVYAIVICPIHPSVHHKPVLYRNDWTNRAGFGIKASFHLSHQQCIIRKFGYLQK